MIERRWLAWPRLPAIGVVAVLGAAAGALPLKYGAVALVGGIAVLAILVNPVLGLAALTVAVPFGPSGDTGSNLPITPTDALVILILGAALLACFSRRKTAVVLTGAFWPSVAFILVALLSATFATDFLVSVKELLRWVELLGILIVTATFCGRSESRYLVVVALLLASSLEALLGWVQFFLRRGPASFRIGPFLRAYGTFGQPNPFGGYLAMTLPIAIALVFWRRPWAGRPNRLTIVAFGAAGICGLALAMSLSRGAWMGVAVGLIVLYWAQMRRDALVVLVAVAAVLVLFGLDALHVVPSSIASRLDQVFVYFGVFDASRVVPNAQNYSIVERMAHWQAAWNMYLAHPILGVGPGHYALAYPEFRVNNFWIYPLGHAHNIYLNVMAETGFLGIAAYLAQFVAWLAVILAGRRRASAPVDRALAAGVLASFVAVAIHNGFDDLYVHGLNAQFGLLVGLAATIGRGRPRDVEESW
ncbi:MAG TPA: O-antigen ligase family protein [Chloroflexota bacterium]|nr:O-antigen ligase family protein [Chloroflexota bacterium]